MPEEYVAPGPSRGIRLLCSLWVSGILLFSGAAIAIPGRSILGSIATHSLSAWEVLATLVGFAFAAFGIWLAWSCRILALPFRFTANSSRRECGYRWGSWWANREDLSGVHQLRGEVTCVVTGPGPGSWRWKIEALRDEERGVIHLLSCLRAFRSERDAAAECRSILSDLSTHLELPLDLISPFGELHED